MIQPILRKLARTAFVMDAVADQADLSAFREHPRPRTIAGLCIIGLSYIIGWPAVSAFGYLAVRLENPLILAVGGPLIYGLSHVVFILGAYVAGTQYTRVFLRWAARMAVERFLKPGPPDPEPGEAAEPMTRNSGP